MNIKSTLFLIYLSRPNGNSIIVAPHNILTNAQVGKIVSFSYGNPKELSIDPKLYRVRDDISWEEVVNSYYQDYKHRNGL